MEKISANLNPDNLLSSLHNTSMIVDKKIVHSHGVNKIKINILLHIKMKNYFEVIFLLFFKFWIRKIYLYKLLKLHIIKIFIILLIHKNRINK